METTNVKVVDRAVLTVARTQRGEKLDEEFAFFIEDSGKAIVQIERATLVGDAHGVVRPAQSMKNDARALGAMALAALAAQIEAAGYGAVRLHAPLTGVDDAVAALRPLFDRTVTALRAEIGEKSPLRQAVSLGIRAIRER